MAGIHPPPSTVVDGNYEWAVDSVPTFRFHHGELQYLMRWVGHQPLTWERATHLTNAVGIVVAFHVRRGVRDADGVWVGYARVGNDIRAFVRRAEDGLRRAERRWARRGC